MTTGMEPTQTSAESPDIEQQIDSIVASDRVVLFMKGNRQAPQCGFSAQVVQMLDRVLPSYTTFDVLSDPSIREGIKAYSDWPTIPQLYIEGQFQGGCDIVREMYDNGELHRTLGLEREEVEPPTVHVSEAAAKVLAEARSQYQDQELHLGIDAGFRHSLGFGPSSGNEIEVEATGVRILLDRDSAERANGLRIEVEGDGNQLRIDNPNQPARASGAPTAVKALSVQELQEMRTKDVAHRLIDVRTEEEREIAAIEGAELLTEKLAQELMALPKDTPLVFHCHHGGRAQGAAEHFAGAGFTDVANLTGGVDAWSQEADPDVARY